MPSQTMAHARTKLKPQEAALLAGEIQKPSWESRNEGIHERVSFEDSIWGFDLAGGSFYKTPLRVTAVKPDSRAEKAGIRPGDRLKRINDIDTSILTIQEAHQIIIESGVHLRLAVTAPEDTEDSYHCWQDQLEDEIDLEELRRKERELEEKRRVHAKVSSYWSLQWPWVSKRRIIYRESNCFMVPSKYESNHKEKFIEQPIQKTTDDVVLFGNKKEEHQKYRPDKTPPQSPLPNGIDDKTPNFPVVNGVTTKNNGFEKIDEEFEETDTKSNDGIIEEILGKDDMKNGDDDKVLDNILNDTQETVDSSAKEEVVANGIDDSEPFSNSEQILEEISHSEEILSGILHSELDLEENSQSGEVLDEMSQDVLKLEQTDALSHSEEIIDNASSSEIIETTNSEEVVDTAPKEKLMNGESHSDASEVSDAAESVTEKT